MSRLRPLIARLAGPLVAIGLVLLVPLDPDRPEVTAMAAVALWMAIWWITEAVPIPVTALLPVPLFPLLGIMPGKKVAPQYFNSVIFLFIGGFIVAIAMQRWELHRRIALLIVRMVGTGPKRLLLGFMIATAFLSMWISNTATTMMMLPIALAVIGRLEESIGGGGESRFGIGLLLAIAYAASIGGLATLVGTPPNLSFARILQITFPDAPEIAFSQWMLFALPLSLTMLGVTWLLLALRFAPRSAPATLGKSVFDEELRRLGPMSRAEKRVLGVFLLLAFLWLTRSDLSLGSIEIAGWASRLGLDGMVDDGTVAIACAILLFILPAGTDDGRRLLTWEGVKDLPWGIVLLFGGGFALAKGFGESGLSIWCGERLAGLSDFPTVGLVLSICLLITFMTELTSNTATTEMILPILAATAVAIETDPLLLMIPATLSASCAFMLPVATPPNAIVFGSGRIRMAEMARTGLLLNLVGAALITLVMLVIGQAVFGIEAGTIPAWATP